MKFFITGGAGFIGNHLAEALLQTGNTVVVYDDFSAGTKDNLNHLHNQGLTVIEASVLDKADLTAAMTGCDAVFHLAAVVGVNRVIADPVHTMETNVNGTLNVLESCEYYKIPVFLSSSSEVYGKSTRPLFCESDDVLYGSSEKFRWSYAASKYIEEQTGLAYYQKNHLPVVIVRLFNVIGIRQNEAYGSVVPTFMRQAIAGLPVTVYGDGEQKRSFTDVREVVRALMLLIGEKQAYGEVVNVGSKNSISINKLADLIINITGSVSKIEHKSYNDAYEKGFEEIQSRVPDLRKLSGLIGFKPAKPLEETVTWIFQYMTSSGIM